MRTKWFEAAEPWRWVGRALRIGLGLAIATLLWIERADAFTATVTTAAPACPVGSYGSTFGRVIVNIADQDACVGEYEVAVLRLDESVVTSTSGPPAGQVILGGISPGSYRVTVKDTTGCDTQVMTFDVTVAAGIDQVPPRLGIVRHDGAYIVDRYSFTPQAPTVDLGSRTLPEGECGFQEEVFFWAGDDNCDGIFSDTPPPIGAFEVVPSLTAMDPGSQAYVDFEDNFGSWRYRINLFWGLGTTTVAFSLKDASGNVGTVTMTRTIVGDADKCKGVSQGGGTDPEPNACTDPSAAPALCSAGGTVFAVAVTGPAGPKYVVCSVVPAGYDGNAQAELRCEGAAPGGTPTLFDPDAIVDRFGSGFCGLPATGG